MAILYRRDVSLMNGGISAVSKRKSGILKDVYDSKLYLNKKMYPCIATFFKFFGAYRIDIINENEKEVYDFYMDFLKNHPRFLFEYTLRNTIKVIATISMLICVVVSFFGVYNLIPVFFLLYLVRLLISLV